MSEPMTDIGGLKYAPEKVHKAVGNCVPSLPCRCSKQTNRANVSPEKVLLKDYYICIYR